MSNRRNFLMVMAGTASFCVLSRIGMGIFEAQPTYGADDPCGSITFETGEIAREGLKLIETVATSGLSLVGSIKSGTASEIAVASKALQKSVSLEAEFWHQPDNVANFVRSASADERKRAVQALKGKFSDKDILAAVRKSAKNLKANNLSAIESDPIIGSVVKAGYAAASSKLKEAADLRRKYVRSLNEIPGAGLNKVETEAIQLKKQSKLTNQQIQQISDRYPSLAPAFKKAIELPSAKPGQLNSKPILLNQLPTNASDPISGTSIDRHKNEFDIYAQAFDSRLLEVTASPSSDYSLLDSLLGIEKAQACEIFCLVVILAIVVAAAVVGVTAIVADAESEKNDAVNECRQQRTVAKASAKCKIKARIRRDVKLESLKNTFTQTCPTGSDSYFCTIGHVLEQSAIEKSYVLELDACS